MSSGQVNPFDSPEAWDLIWIGDTPSPGMCKVGDFKRSFEWDVKKGKGTLGATVTFVGRPPAKGTVTFYLWTAQHFNDWDVFRPLLKYDPTKKSVQAVGIYHPSLDDIDVHTVVCEDIGNIIHEGNQLYSVTVSFLEYFPPPKKSSVSTPTHATQTTDPKANPAPSAQDAQQQEIARLLAEATAP